MARRMRLHHINFYLDDEELNRLTQLTEASGLSRSGTLRKLILEGKLLQIPSQELLDFNRQLLSIGNNLNQIAAAANARGLIDAPYYREQAKQLQALRMWILEFLGQLQPGPPPPDPEDTTWEPEAPVIFSEEDFNWR